MPIVKTHPVTEAVARKLSGIERVPLPEQRKMIVRAAKVSAKMCDEAYQRGVQDTLKQMREPNPIPNDGTAEAASAADRDINGVLVHQNGSTLAC